MNVETERKQVVEVALTWRYTPFHENARVKGAGVGCGQLLLAIYEECGVLPAFDPGHWTRDWFMHKEAEERLLPIMLKFGVEVVSPPDRAPLPGDAVLWRFGHKWAHNGIVIRWPHVIHATAQHGVDVEDVTRRDFTIGEAFESEELRLALAGRERPMKVFVPKRWLEGGNGEVL